MVGSELVVSRPTGPSQRAVPAAYGLALVQAIVAASLIAVVPHLWESSFDSPWWMILVIGVGFGVAEHFLFDVELRRESISFSLSEVPTVFALAFLGPIPAVAIRIVASMVSVALSSRPPLFKFVFNASLFALEAAIAFSVVRRIAPPGSEDPGRFIVAATIGAMVASVAGLVLVCVVISFFEGQLRSRISDVLRSNLLTATTNSMIGAVAIAPALFGLRYAWLPLLPIASAWMILRRHGELTQRFRNLSAMHAFSRTLDQSLQLDLVAPKALDEISRLVHAGRVTLRLGGLSEDDEHRTWCHGAPIDLARWPRRPEQPWVSSGIAAETLESCTAFVVPILVEGDVLGLLALAGCETRAATFGEDDVERAVDLAEQLGASFRNALLHASVELAATHDALTSDANRTAFETRLVAELTAPRRTTLAVIVLDLNQFKEVNDTLGHHVGDQVLIEFSRRVGSVLDAGDLLARFGGDEFAILVKRQRVDEVRDLAERILSMSYTPLALDGCDAVVTSSIGIAFVGEYESDPAGILRRADIAMYAAKNQRIGIEVYREEIDRRTPARLSLLGDLRSSIERNELEVHFQPKVELRTSTVVGAEALVRWKHPERGWVTPDEFIGVAEESGLIRLVTDVVLDRAIRRATEWHAAGYDLDVSANLSALDLHDEELAGRIGRKLSDHGLDPRRLILEITESALMVDTVRTIATIEQLDLLGVRLSLDDFGTGYSSLSYLRRLPVSELKIDRGFVSDLLLNVHDDVIVRSTVDLGHNLGLRVVAEGIENSQVFDHLASLGCDMGQGFGIARPLAAELFTQWLETTTHEVKRLVTDEDGTRLTSA